MIVKPYISFLNYDSDGELIVDVGAILTAMTGNANYTSPSPALAVVTAAWNEFSGALSNAADGGRTLTAIKNAKRAALVALARALAVYVQGACKGDMTILLSSGFPTQKPDRQPVGVLPVPANLAVALGARNGELDVSVTPVPGAAIYNWRVAAASAPPWWCRWCNPRRRARPSPV